MDQLAEFGLPDSKPKEKRPTDLIGYSEPLINSTNSLPPQGYSVNQISPIKRPNFEVPAYSQIPVPWNNQDRYGGGSLPPVTADGHRFHK